MKRFVFLFLLSSALAVTASLLTASKHGAQLPADLKSRMRRLPVPPLAVPTPGEARS